MNRSSAIYLAVLAAIGASTSFAATSSAPELLVVGPVESIDLTNRTATVLGQRVAVENVDVLTVGNTVALYGSVRPNGTVELSGIRDQGIYTPGATAVFISGTVQRSEPAIGHVVLNGVNVDLTAAMSSGRIVPAVGAKMSIRGTQPVHGGVVLVDGIVGSGAAANGIVGSGAAANGIVGSGAAANGIVGSGLRPNGIVGSGSAANGIVGSGAAANGIVGSGAAANGIVGSGLHPNGIVGSGSAANGIVGTASAANGIVGSGSAANGIVGSGLQPPMALLAPGAAANGIVGSGLRANGIVGSGSAANGIVGSGSAANGIVGSGCGGQRHRGLGRSR